MTTIARNEIVEALRDRGQHMRAEWVDRELPEDVDTTKHSGLLATLNIEVAELTSRPPA